MFKTAEDALKFILAGNARVTLVSKKTGTRFTYRVRKPNLDDDRAPWFVSVLTGSDNEGDYTFLGTIFPALFTSPMKFGHGRRSSIAPTAPSAVAFEWMIRHLLAGNLPDTIELHHEGRCGRCGRALTVPESIESGFGPECINKI